MNWRILAVLAVSASLLAAEEGQQIVARIVDSSSERVPQLTVAPEYPRKARRDRIEGEVQVCFEIDREGRTHRVSVRNSTNRAFEKPSINAVRASSFRPLDKDETLPAIKYCRSFIFVLEPRVSEEASRSSVE
jgi:TonB family protein